MLCKVLINDAIKRFLIDARPALRRQLRKSFEYLENGLWEGGLRIKKLRGVNGKTVLEGRVSRSSRILITLGRDQDENGVPVLLIYVWAVVPHDLVDSQARAIMPENAPFLSFTDFDSSLVEQVEIERLDDGCFTQEPITARASQDTGSQKWFVLDDQEWKRLLLYSEGEFDIFLYLTPEQRELLKKSPPLLVSGTAGSGKTTLSVYYLLHPGYIGWRRLFLTYNRHLRNFSERLYRSLVRAAERVDADPPEFLTFRDLCLRLIPGCESRFPVEREVDLPVFRDLYARHRTAGRFDSALVWEEIRSIIKGAKPQLDARVLRRIVADLDAGADAGALISGLREEILALRNLGIFEKAEAVAQRIMGQRLAAIAAELPRILEKQRLALVRTLHAVSDVIDKHEADFAAPLMTFAEYERLGRKRAPVFLQDRREIYAVAEWYQARLQAERMWDEIDLTRAAIRSMESGQTPPPRYDLVCCDEVQDFTDIQLSMIVRLPRNPARLLLAGDPKQIINPSGFRWEEAKDLFYDRGIPVPPVHHLTLNFRCVGSIVLLANALLTLKQQLLGVKSGEHLDEWKFHGRPPFLVEGVSDEDFLGGLRITAADRTILTRTTAERDFLKRRLETELVFTIREAKGLEFKTVLLWKFCSDAAAGDTWERMLNAETAALHDHQIRHEINLLYVGITRAQQDLILYDGPRISAIWASPMFEDLVHRSSDMTFLDEAWRATSSPEDWKRQGDYFMEHGHFRAAADCFRNADRPDLMARAKAMDYGKSKEFIEAAKCWLEVGEDRLAAENFERGARPGLAQPVWERLGEKARAAECWIGHLEAEARFAEAAELREARREFDKAIEDWRRADRQDRLAALLERLKRWADAARAFRAARDFENATRLFLKVRDAVSAAACLEDAGQFPRAAQIWKRLRRPADRLRCLTRSGDPVPLGELHEECSKWDQASECYRRALGPELRARFDAELQAKPRRRTDHARRALRMELLGVRGAGAEWSKAGHADRAAQAFKKDHEYHEAARHFQKLGQRLDAAAMYAMSPEDRERGSKDLHRCTRRIIRDQGYPALETLARSLRKAKEYKAAAAIFHESYRSVEAAECLVMAGDIENALHEYGRARDVASIVQCALKTDEIPKGIQVISELIKWTPPTEEALNPLEDGLKRLVEAWLAKDRSEETRLAIATELAKDFRMLPWRLAADILLPLGWYDELLNSVWHGPGGVFAGGPDRTWEERKARIKDRAVEAESSGDNNAAGFFYVAARCREDARRCWAGMQLTEHNSRCFSLAGSARMVADHFLKRGDFRRAATALFEGDEPLAGAEILERAGDFLEAGWELRRAGLFEEAARMFLKGGNLRETARMLEYDKQWAAAAALYEELGDAKRQAACAKKASRSRQPQLF